MVKQFHCPQCGMEVWIHVKHLEHDTLLHCVRCLGPLTRMEKYEDARVVVRVHGS